MHHIKHSVTSEPPLSTRKISLTCIPFYLLFFGIDEYQSDAVPVKLLSSSSVSVSESDTGTISAYTAEVTYACLSLL